MDRQRFLLAMSTDDLQNAQEAGRVRGNTRWLRDNQKEGDGQPLQGSATPRDGHSQGLQFPGCVIICGIQTFCSPYPFYITSKRRELDGNGKYISCASKEAGVTKIIVYRN